MICSAIVGPWQVSVWQDKDLLSSWSSGISREAEVWQIACLQHHDSEDGQRMVGKTALHEGPKNGASCSDVWPWNACKKVGKPSIYCLISVGFSLCVKKVGKPSIYHVIWVGLSLCAKNTGATVKTGSWCCCYETWYHSYHLWFDFQNLMVCRCTYLTIACIGQRWVIFLWATLGWIT